MNIIVSIAVIYFIIVFAIGVWAMNRTKSAADFFIAGKSLGIFVMAMSVFATALSGFLFLGGPWLTYSLGMGALWFTLPTTVSLAMAWHILGKRMRLITEAYGAMTVADAVHARFNNRAASGLTGFATLIGIIVFLATQVLSPWYYNRVYLPDKRSRRNHNRYGDRGTVLHRRRHSRRNVHERFSGYHNGDRFNRSICLRASCRRRHDEYHEYNSRVAVYGHGRGNARVHWSVGTCRSDTVHELVLRTFDRNRGPASHRRSIVHDKGYQQAQVGTGCGCHSRCTSRAAFFGVGLVMRFLVMTGEIEPLANPDNAILVFLTGYTPPFLAGLVLAGVTSAIMSTCDAFINVSSAAVVRDVPHAFGRSLTDRQQLVWGRVSVVAISVLTVLAVLALGDQGIALPGAVGWGTFAAALAPTLGIGLNWKRATSQGAIASLIVGLSVAVVFEVLATLEIYSLPYGMYIGAFAMVLSVITFIGVSYLTPAQPLTEKMERIMNA